MSNNAAPGAAPAVVRLVSELEALDRAYSPGHHGRWSAHRRTELVDTCVRELFSAASAADLAGPVALLAIGGYGRAELAPASDIDLLLVHDGEHPDAVATLAQSLLYPLWDTGLSVGHAVRTPLDCLAYAAGRVDAATAMLDARLVAGDEVLAEQVRADVFGWIREDPAGFAVRLREAMLERHRRYGTVSHHLEPDVKEGSGGLRDIQTLGWLAAVGGETSGAPTLDGVGMLRAVERDEIDAATEFLTRVRSAVHLQTRTKTDRLPLDRQPDIARDMGFADEPGLVAVDGLMRAVFTHARQVEHVVACVFERYLGGEEETGDPDPTPEGVLTAFALAAEEGRRLSPTLLDRIEEIELPSPVTWTPQVRSAFLRILRSGDGGIGTLEAMDRVGLLERFLPAWAAVRCRPQRDPYHRYTVDVHLLEALAGVARLISAADGAPIEDPLAAELLSLVGDRDALLLGALFHDVGKTGEGRHVPVGARIADETLETMGIPAPTREMARFMVANHLLLPDTATRRDLGDEDLIMSVAATVETLERLAGLYLLAIADAGATGPHAWTPWRRTLVQELVRKVRNVLERGEMSADHAERLEAQVSAIRRLLAAEDPAAVETFVGRVPPAYLLAVTADLAAEHFRLLSSPIGATEVRTLSAPGPRSQIHQLTVVAADRHGLLSLVAGALSLAGLSILSAQVFTTEDDVAMDLFEIEGSFEGDVAEERWRTFRSALRKAIEGKSSLEHRVADKRRHYPVSTPRSAVKITVDNEASDFFTVIEVGAPDRLGLLYDITRTLAELGLDVHLAKVATYGERVIDAFYVRDTVGRKIVDTAALGGIERILAERAAH
ncbi:MAG: ACT domain-containing protein [Actinomycetota bacterium]